MAKPSCLPTIKKNSVLGRRLGLTADVRGPMENIYEMLALPAAQQRTAVEALEGIPYEKRTDKQHRAFIRKKFRQAFTEKGVPEEQVNVTIALMDARSVIHSPDNPARWFRKLQDVTSGESFGSANVRYQEPSTPEEQAEYDAAVETMNKIDAQQKALLERYSDDMPADDRKSLLAELNALSKPYYDALAIVERYDAPEDEGDVMLFDEDEENIEGTFTDIGHGLEFFDAGDDGTGTVRDRHQPDDYVSLHTWTDEDGKEYYYFSADVPYNELKAGRMFKYLEARIPKDSEILEPNSLSLDSFTNVLRRTRQSDRFGWAYKGHIPLSKSGVRTMLQNQLNTVKDSYWMEFRKAKDAKNAAEGINGLLKSYGLPPAATFQKEDNGLYQVMLPNIALKKLYQRAGGGKPKGATETLASGRLIIHAMNAPDFSTAVHEIAHVFEDELSNEDMATVVNWAADGKADVIDQGWNDQTSEAFARGFERYLRDGHAPTKAMQSIFEQAKQWLQSIYQSLIGSPLERNISPEVKGVFDRLFTGGTATATAAPVNQEMEDSIEALYAAMNPAMNPAEEPVEEVQPVEEEVAVEDASPSQGGTVTAASGGQLMDENTPMEGQSATPAGNPKFDDLKTKFNQARKWVSTHVMEWALPNGEVIRARWALVPTGAPTPSHDPTKGFSDSHGFPVDGEGRNVNSTNYRRNETQAAVHNMAGKFNQSALQNPPIISRDGVVVSGNNRFMSATLAEEKGTRSLYDNELLNRIRAGQLHGITMQDYGHVAQSGTPMLVLMMEATPQYTPGFFSVFNRSDDKAPSTTALTEELGRTIRPEVMTRLAAEMEPFETMSALYRNRGASKRIFDLLEAAGVFNVNKRAQYISAKNVVSPLGKHLLESAMIGNLVAFESVEALDEGEDMQGYRAKIVRAIVDLNALTQYPKYNLGETIDNAVSLLNEFHASNFSDFGQFLLQQSMEYMPNRSTESIMMAYALRENPTTFKGVISEVRQGAEGAARSEMSQQQQTAFEVEEVTPPEQKELLTNALKLDNARKSTIEQIAALNESRQQPARAGAETEQAVVTDEQQPAQQGDEQLQVTQTQTPPAAPVSETQQGTQPQSQPVKKGADFASVTDLRAAIRQLDPQAQTRKITRPKLEAMYDRIAAKQAAGEFTGQRPDYKMTIADRPEGGNIVYRISVNGKDSYMQKTTGRSGEAWFAVNKEGDGWKRTGRSLGTKQQEAIDELLRTSMGGKVLFQQPGQGGAAGNLRDAIANAVSGVQQAINSGQDSASAVDAAVEQLRQWWAQNMRKMPFQEGTVRQHLAQMTANMQPPAQPQPQTQQNPPPPGGGTAGQSQQSPPPPGGTPPAAETEEEEPTGPESIRSTQADTAAMRQQTGLPPMERQPQTQESWEKAADAMIKDPNFSIEDLLDKVLEKAETLTHEERIVLNRYYAATESRIRQINEAYTQAVNAGDRAKMQQLNEQRGKALNDQYGFIKAAEAVSTAWGRLGLAIQRGTPMDESLANLYAQWQEQVTKGEPFSQEDMDFVAAAHEEIRKANEAYKAEIARLQAENARLKADQTVKNAEKEQKEEQKEEPKGGQAKTEKGEKKKKTREDLEAEKKKLIEAIRKKLAEARGRMNTSIIGGVETLFNIAPEVARLAVIQAKLAAMDDTPVTVDSITDGIMNNLKDDVEGLSQRDIHDMISGYGMPKKEQSEEMKQLSAVKVEMRLISELEDLLAGKKLKGNLYMTQSERKEKIRELKRKITALRRVLAKGEARTPEQVKKELEKIKKRYQTMTENLEAKMAAGDYTPIRQAQQIDLDEEGEAKRKAYVEAKQRFNAEMQKRAREQRSGGEKFASALAQTLKASSSWLTIGDVPAFRQAVMHTFIDPKNSLKSFKKAIDEGIAKGGIERYQQWFENLRESPEWELIQKAGLHLTDIYDPDDRDLAHMDNVFQQIPESGIPVVSQAAKGAKRIIKASERMQSAYLNLLRLNLFMEEANMLEKDNYSIDKDPEEFKAIAKVINTFTGFGELPPWARGAERAVGALLFSSRFTAARLAPFNPGFWSRLTPRARRKAGEMLGKHIGVTAALMLALTPLLRAFGNDIEWDPHSTNFMRMRIGKTWYDPTGNIGGILRYMTQFATEERKTQAGNYMPIDVYSFPFEGRSGLIINYVRGKLAPVPGALWSLADRQDAGGNPVAMTDLINPLANASIITPLPLKELGSIWKEYGVDYHTPVTMASSFLGMSSQTQNPEKQAAEKKVETQKRKFDSKMERRKFDLKNRQKSQP